MNARDELIEILHQTATADRVKNTQVSHVPVVAAKVAETADAILTAGYRKIFDGDCGLSNVKDPTDREAAEAWMRWANLVSGEDPDGIAAMKQMLTEFGYRKPRTITTAEELDALPCGSVFRDDNERIWEVEKIGYGGVEKALSAMGIGSMLAFRSFRTFPATVLHEPEPGQ